MITQLKKLVQGSLDPKQYIHFAVKNSNRQNLSSHWNHPEEMVFKTHFKDCRANSFNFFVNQAERVHFEHILSKKKSNQVRKQRLAKQVLFRIEQLRV